MMSLMYSRKKVVDRVLPCGIPCVIVRVFDCACWVCVVWVRFLKYVLKKVTVSAVKLKSCLSLWSSFSCEIVSYALDRSMYIASVGCLFCLCLWISSMIVCSASVVLELGLKAYCVGEMILCLVRCSMIWLLIRVSMSLAMMGRREIGL